MSDELSITSSVLSLLAQKLREYNIDIDEQQLNDLYCLFKQKNKSADTDSFVHEIENKYGIEITEADKQAIKKGENVSSSDNSYSKILSLQDMKTRMLIKNESINAALVGVLNTIVDTEEKSLKSVKENNGKISSLYDGIKNIFHFSSGSEKIFSDIKSAKEKVAGLKNHPEKLPYVYEEITGNKLDAEEIDAIYDGKVDYSKSEFINSSSKYRSGQKVGVNVISGLASALSVTGVVLSGAVAAPFTGGLSLGASLTALGILGVTGGAAYMLPQVVDGMTEKDGYSKKEILEDTAHAVLNGTVNALSLGAGNIAGEALGISAAGKAAGEVAETVAGEAAKTVIKESTTSGAARLIQAEAAAVTAGSGNAAGEYIIETASDSDKKFSLKEFGKTVAGAGVASLAAGAAASGAASSLSSAFTAEVQQNKLFTEFFKGALTGAATGGAASAAAGGTDYIINCMSEGKEINFSEWLDSAKNNLETGILTGMFSGIAFEAFKITAETPSPKGSVEARDGIGGEGLKYEDYIDADGNVIAVDVNADEFSDYLKGNYSDNSEIVINDGNSDKNIRFNFDVKESEISGDSSVINTGASDIPASSDIPQGEVITPDVNEPVSEQVDIPAVEEAVPEVSSSSENVVNTEKLKFGSESKSYKTAKDNTSDTVPASVNDNLSTEIADENVISIEDASSPVEDIPVSEVADNAVYKSDVDRDDNISRENLINDNASEAEVVSDITDNISDGNDGLSGEENISADNNIIESEEYSGEEMTGSVDKSYKSFKKDMPETLGDEPVLTETPELPDETDTSLLDGNVINPEFIDEKIVVPESETALVSDDNIFSEQQNLVSSETAAASETAEQISSPADNTVTDTTGTEAGAIVNAVNQTKENDSGETSSLPVTAADVVSQAAASSSSSSSSASKSVASQKKTGTRIAYTRLTEKKKKYIEEIVQQKINANKYLNSVSDNNMSEIIEVVNSVQNYCMSLGINISFDTLSDWFDICGCYDKPSKFTQMIFAMNYDSLVKTIVRLEMIKNGMGSGEIAGNIRLMSSEDDFLSLLNDSDFYSGDISGDKKAELFIEMLLIKAVKNGTNIESVKAAIPKYKSMYELSKNNVPGESSGDIDLMLAQYADIFDYNEILNNIYDNIGENENFSLSFAEGENNEIILTVNKISDAADETGELFTVNAFLPENDSGSSVIESLSPDNGLISSSTASSSPENNAFSASSFNKKNYAGSGNEKNISKKIKNTDNKSGFNSVVSEKIEKTKNNVTYTGYAKNKEKVSQTSLRLDKNSNPRRAAHTEKSKFIPGCYDTSIYSINEKMTVKDAGKAAKNGTLKHGKALSYTSKNDDGSFTHKEKINYRNKSTSKSYNVKDKSSSYSFKITSTDGKKILEIKRRTSFVKNGSSVTVVNGKKFKADFNDMDLIVSVYCDDGNKMTLNLNNELSGYSSEQKANFYNSLKNLQVDSLFEIKRALTYFGNKTGVLNEKNSSDSGSEMKLTKNFELDRFLNIAVSKRINTDTELNNIFKKELNLFKQENYELAEKFLNNSLYIKDADGDEYTGILAESNSLLKSPATSPESGITRAQILAEYFTETLIKVAELTGITNINVA